MRPQFPGVFSVLSMVLACMPAAAQNPVHLPVVSVLGAGQDEAPDSSYVSSDPSRAQELSEVLGRAAGVQVRSQGGLGAYSEASLRGSSSRQVQILFDGIPLEVAGGQSINLALFPAAVVESATIYRGMLPLGLQAGAAGAINLLPPASGQERRRLHAQYGSFSTWRSSLLENGAAGLFSLGYERSDNDFPIQNPYKPFDPDDPERRAEEPRQHAAIKQHFGLWRKQWSTRRSDIEALVYGFDQRQQLPDRVNSPDPQTRFDSDLLLANLRLRPVSGSSYDLQVQQLGEHYLDPGSRIGLSRQNLKTRSRRIAISSQHNAGRWGWKPAFSWQEFRSEDFLATTNRSIRAQRLQLRLDGQWLARPRAGLQLNAQTQMIALAERSSQTGSTNKPRLVVQPQWGWHLDATTPCQPLGHFAWRERIPGFVERYGDRGYIKGNPDLLTEKAAAVDAGLLCPAPGRRLRAAAFFQDIRNAISYVYDARGVGRAANTQRARVYGLELESDWQPHPAVAFTLNSTWLTSEDRSDIRASRGQQLPGRARWQIYSRLTYSGASSTWLDWSVFQEFHFESGRYYDSSNLLKAPPTRLLNSGLRLGRGPARVAIEARNWIDQTPAQFNGYPQPGRSWNLTFTFRFDQGPSA